MAYKRAKHIRVGGKVYTYYYLVESKREGKKVKQKYVAYLGKNGGFSGAGGRGVSYTETPPNANHGEFTAMSHAGGQTITGTMLAHVDQFGINVKRDLTSTYVLKQSRRKRFKPFHSPTTKLKKGFLRSAPTIHVHPNAKARDVARTVGLALDYAHGWTSRKAFKDRQMSKDEVAEINRFMGRMYGVRLDKRLYKASKRYHNKWHGTKHLKAVKKRVRQGKASARDKGFLAKYNRSHRYVSVYRRLTAPSERHATLFATCALDPKRAKRLAPTWARSMENSFNNNPEVKTFVASTRKQAGVKAPKFDDTSPPKRRRWQMPDTSRPKKVEKGKFPGSK